MRRLFWNLSTNAIQTTASFGQNLGDVVGGAQGGIEGPVNTVMQLEIGFVQPTSRVAVNIGADPGIAARVKFAAGSTEGGTQRFDQPAVLAVTTWTQFTETIDDETNYFYRGFLDLRAAVVQKLMGMDYKRAKEQVAVQCFDDVDGLSHGAYFYVVLDDGTKWAMQLKVDGNPVTAPTGMYATTVVDISTGDDAATIAAAVLADWPETTQYTVTRDDDTVTFTAVNAGTRGFAAASDATFVISFVQAGMAGLQTTDVETKALEMELAAEVNGEVQVARRFSFTLRNSFLRETSAEPITDGGTNVRRGAVVLTAGQNYVDVTWAVPLSETTWRVRRAALESALDTPTELIGLGPISTKTETGFRQWLDGPPGDTNLTYYFEVILD